MSTVKAVNFQHPSSTAANLTLAADGTVTGGLPAGGRNLLYNGAMQVAQRGTSTAGISSIGGYFTADRWSVEMSNLGTFTMSVENDAPTGSGLRKSVKMLCTTADAAPAAGDLLGIAQQLEGQDLQRVAKGTASAQQLTLSFWVKSNVTGTYIAYLYDNDNTRHVAASYTISASATWEKKTITFPADTTGAFDNDNAGSLYCLFHLGVGSNFNSGTLATSWASYTAANRAVGQTNLAAAINNYWQITGVQLEVGPVASAFEFKSYGQELRECQRYYYRVTPGAQDVAFGSGFAYATTLALVQVPFPVTMRIAATALEQNGTAADYRVFNSSAAGVNCSSVVTFNKASSAGAQVVATVASGLTAGNGTLLAATGTSAYLAWSAEL